MKYQVLTEVIDNEAGNRFYIQAKATGEILYETATKWQATEICALWNANASPTYRTDGTLNLDTPSL